MYDTTLGIRVLYGAEARLFAKTVWSLTDQLRDDVPDSVGPSFVDLFGMPVLASLTAAQVIVLLDRVTACLLDPNTEAPARTAVLDAAIAGVFQQGWRPEKWRFGGGVPRPDDAGFPPQVDVLSFPEFQPRT